MAYAGRHPRPCPAIKKGAGALKRYAFSKADRLRTSSDYREVSASGKRWVCGQFVVLARRNGRSRSRLGITVSRKVGHAVTRNRIKRIVRDYFRLNRDPLPAALDLNVIARQSTGKRDNAAIRDNLGRCFEELIRNAF